MTNILLEGYDINAPYLFDEVTKHIKPHHYVAVVALSFRDRVVRNLSDWNDLYSPESGMYYSGITSGFAAYGIPAENITFLNYFTDTSESASQKIRNADIIYFLGGLPDRMMDRIDEFGLREVLLTHNGVIMGYSAGAVIQLAEYHLSPDKDYLAFGYYKGLPYLDSFYLEVHYDGSEEQNVSIRRVLRERTKTVYATTYMSGAIVIHGGEIKLLGDVKVFSPGDDL